MLNIFCFRYSIAENRHHRSKSSFPGVVAVILLLFGLLEMSSLSIIVNILIATNTAFTRPIITIQFLIHNFHLLFSNRLIVGSLMSKFTIRIPLPDVSIPCRKYACPPSHSQLNYKKRFSERQ